jgi:uncharacterized membrane protein HdeD (DUF308 family)
MKTTNQWLISILIGAVAIAAGVFLFFQTEEFAKVLVFGIGVFVFINGASALYLATRKGFSQWGRNTYLIRGVLGIVVGLVAILLPLAVAKNIWYTMVYVLGVELALAGILALLNISGLKKQGLSLYRPLANALVSLVLALVIFIMPQESGQVLLSLIAAAAVIYGLTMILIGLNRRKNVKSASKAAGTQKPVDSGPSAGTQADPKK